MLNLRYVTPGVLNRFLIIVAILYCDRVVSVSKV